MKTYEKPVLTPLNWTNCFADGCVERANYVYHRQGRRIHYCFGHGTVAKRYAGRIERMWTP